MLSPDVAAGGSALALAGSLVSLRNIIAGRADDAVKALASGRAAVSALSPVSALSSNPAVREALPSIVDFAPEWLRTLNQQTLGTVTGATTFVPAAVRLAAEASEAGQIATKAAGVLGETTGALAPAIGNIPLLPAIGTGLNVWRTLANDQMPEENKIGNIAGDLVALGSYAFGPEVGIPVSIFRALLGRGPHKEPRTPQRVLDAQTIQTKTTARLKAARETLDWIDKAESVADVLAAVDTFESGRGGGEEPMAYVVAPEQVESVTAGFIAPEGPQRGSLPPAAVLDAALPSRRRAELLQAVAQDPRRLFIDVRESDTQGVLHNARLVLTHAARTKAAALAAAGKIEVAPARKAQAEAEQFAGYRGRSGPSWKRLASQLRWMGFEPDDLARIEATTTPSSQLQAEYGQFKGEEAFKSRNPGSGEEGPVPTFEDFLATKGPAFVQRGVTEATQSATLAPLRKAYQQYVEDFPDRPARAPMAFGQFLDARGVPSLRGPAGAAPVTYTQAWDEYRRLVDPWLAERPDQTPPRPLDSFDNYLTQRGLSQVL